GGARQHAVFRRHPAAAGIAQEGRHLLFHRGGTEHMGFAELHQTGALGIFGKARLQTDGAELVGLAAARTHGILLRTTLSAESAVLVDSIRSDKPSRGLTSIML